MSNGIPPSHRDEYYSVKIFLAFMAVGTVILVTVCAAFGYIPMTNPVVQTVVPLFNTLVGVAIGFFFGRNGRNNNNGKV